MITGIPKKIIQNSTASCLIEVSGYTPVEGWALTLALRGPGKSNAAGVVLGSGWSVVLPTDIPVGLYWWQVVVQRDGEQHVPLSGKLEVSPDLLAEEAGFDGRTENEKALEAVDAALAGRATNAVWNYEINGRKIQYYSIDQLKKLRGMLATKVLQERGKNKFRSVRVRV
ncbi:hypothetical protein D0S45_17430 [Marinifilum sp. JC120]|nr:hypothetical protein D0S45_17430 [Marinifilum sp. JC120]